MKNHIRREKLCGMWSAVPTPFTEKMKVDVVAVRRMVKHHLRLGVKGLFLCGTCGEGALLTQEQRHCLVQTAAEYAKGELVLAVQVTDNCSARILDNINFARKDGADIAIIAEPYFVMPAKPQVILNTYVKAIRQSPLPVGIYDRGRYATVFVPNSILGRIYAEENVILVKDSSVDPGRRKIALAARRRRPRLCLLNGGEFDCVEPLKAGYDGLLLGGGVFNAYLAGMIMEAVKQGKLELAKRLQHRMNRIMWAVYGGKSKKCWLSGEKKLLVEMGIFRTWKNYYGYPLTDSCCRAIARVLEEDADILWPWRGSHND